MATTRANPTLTINTNVLQGRQEFDAAHPNRTLNPILTGVFLRQLLLKAYKSFLQSAGEMQKGLL